MLIRRLRIARVRFTISVEQWIQQLAQGATAAKNSRFHSPYRYFEDLGNLFVR
jgi:hypothetical protein